MYWLYRAARYCGVAPWEMADQSTYWRDWALAFEGSEKWAEHELIERGKKRPTASPAPIGRGRGRRR